MDWERWSSQGNHINTTVAALADKQKKRARGRNESEWNGSYHRLNREKTGTLQRHSIEPKSTVQRIEHIHEDRVNGKALAEINGIDIRITMQCSTENADSRPESSD